MKRLLYILVALLLLIGCGGNAAGETTLPPETTEPTEPPIPWIETAGMPWDEEGILLEMPLNIPDALHYTTFREFDGDLLMWSVDNHLENVYTLELCLVELDDGTVSAQKEISFSDWVSPQILGDRMYLCDRYTGTLMELNKELNVISSWVIEPVEASLIMGADEMLYIYDWNGSVMRRDLETGEENPLLEGQPYIDLFNEHGETVSIEYYSPESGVHMMAVLDLRTGEIFHPPVQGRYTSALYMDGTWLCEYYDEGLTYYLGTDETDFVQSYLGYNGLQLLDGNTLLKTNEDAGIISLHDLSGKALAKVQLVTEPYSFGCTGLIRSEHYGGYFVLITDYNNSFRLLYWDQSRSEAGEDIVFEPIPEPGELEAAVRQRADQLSNEYGLNILVGQDCGTYFFDFSVEHVTDWMDISNALDTLEDALEDYPEDFFRQLRYGDIRSVEIHLVGTLTATNAEYVDTYSAFVQEEYDAQVMVVDIYLAGEQTFYHEFSHIIDAFLTWDAMIREDALFSEETWNSLNPSWFPGYSYDYSRELFLVDDVSFVDSYSTIKPTEDRARVMEYAMVDYGQWTFQGKETLTAKLDYYCLCIRDAFDTSGWPETVLWEQYLQ